MRIEVRAVDCRCSFEGSKQCCLERVRYKTPVELLTKFSWGNTSSGNHSGQVVPVFGHTAIKKAVIWLGFSFPLYLSKVSCTYLFAIVTWSCTVYH